MSEAEIKEKEDKSAEGKSKHHSSGGSHSHSHHHHHRHHHHHSEGSHSGSSRRRDDDKKKETNENFSAEYSKHKKIRLWWRTSFISVVCLALAVLVILIANSGKYQDGFFTKKYSPSVGAGELQKENAELKAENNRLKYELEKYVNMYGELGETEKETNTEPVSENSGTVKKEE